MFRAISLIFLLPLLATAQEIAITFDDAPTGDGPLLSGSERTKRIVASLRKERVEQVAFFVLTGAIDETNVQRLKDYVAAGHVLGNHSHSHRWIHEQGTTAYIRDLIRADSILSTLPGYVRWFRYPFLDEGKTLASRDSIREALHALHLHNGYVTIDNYDWYLHHLLRQAKDQDKDINLEILREIYIDHIYNSILFYDNIARAQLGRSPKHVLLLHENDLSAFFVGDLIAHLKKKGWKIITPREAYQDPIAFQIPDVLFNGQGRIAAIARLKGIPARELVQESEDEVYLEKLMTEKKVFE